LLNSGGSNAKLGTGPYLVAEADESDASFLHLQPVMTVLTNIDSDHLDTYGGDFENLKSNFLEFLHNIPFYGLAVMCCDDTGVQSILPKLNRPFVTYGVTEQADYHASNIRYANTKTRFTVSRIDQKNWLEIELNMPGKHNVLNALAAISIAAELELSEDSIVKALSNFAGIGRRCDVLGEININNNQILLIDDYAHHPCEIAAITDAVRSGWPERRIVAIFQPHRYSRTRDLFDDFCQALSELDVLILLDVYPAGELPISSADSRALSRSIRSRGKLEPLFVEQRDELKTMLPNIVQDKDVLLILGAGDIGSLSKEIYEANGG